MAAEFQLRTNRQIQLRTYDQTVRYTMLVSDRATGQYRNERPIPVPLYSYLSAMTVMARILNDRGNDAIVRYELAYTNAREYDLPGRQFRAVAWTPIDLETHVSYRIINVDRQTHQPRGLARTELIDRDYAIKYARYCNRESVDWQNGVYVVQFCKWPVAIWRQYAAAVDLQIDPVTGSERWNIA